MIVFSVFFFSLLVQDPVSGDLFYCGFKILSLFSSLPFFVHLTKERQITIRSIAVVAEKKGRKWKEHEEKGGGDNRRPKWAAVATVGAQLWTQMMNATPEASEG